MPCGSLSGLVRHFVCRAIKSIAFDTTTAQRGAGAAVGEITQIVVAGDD